VPDLKVTSQLLRSADLLTGQTMVLTVAQGVRVRLPAPAAFLLHKMLIASLWQRGEKQEKDLRQAIAITAYVLRDHEQRRQLASLWSGMPAGWRRKVASSLDRARRLDPLRAPTLDRLAELLS
jgi:hypothetical protein